MKKIGYLLLVAGGLIGLYFVAREIAAFSTSADATARLVGWRLLIGSVCGAITAFYAWRTVVDARRGRTSFGYAGRGTVSRQSHPVVYWIVLVSRVLIVLVGGFIATRWLLG